MPTSPRGTIKGSIRARNAVPTMTSFGVSNNKGPEYRPQNRRALSIRAPQKRTPAIYRNRHVVVQRLNAFGKKFKIRFIFQAKCSRLYDCRAKFKNSAFFLHINRAGGEFGEHFENSAVCFGGLTDFGCRASSCRGELLVSVGRGSCRDSEPTQAEPTQTNQAYLGPSSP